MSKRQKQRDIQHKALLDTEMTGRWIKAQGLSEEHFSALDVQILQAQRIAHNCLKHHGQLLLPNEASVLNNFLKATNNKAQRQRLKPAQTLKVMNLGTSINRRVFRQLKQSKAKQGIQ